MKTRIVAILSTLFITLPSKSETVREETERASKLERSADVVVDYDEERGLDIGVTSKGEKVYYTLEDLTGYFDKIRHKDMIVVTLSKVDMGDQAVKARIKALKDNLVKRGFRRIVVLVYGNNYPIDIYLDHKTPAKQKKS